MFSLIATNPLLGYLFIFFARICDVSLDVFRLLMLARGYAALATFTGFFEVIIYVVALGTVISGGFKDVFTIIAYAAGFATGNMVGTLIEGKMAIGYIVIQMYPAEDCCEHLTTLLRNSSYGVTKLTGEGSQGPREVLVVTAKRKDQAHILRLMNHIAPDTFFNISDVRSTHGGIFPRHR